MIGDYFLAADIGGTKSELALYPLADQAGEPVAQVRIGNRGRASLAEIVADYLEGQEIRPIAACIDVAGVVEGRVARLTNLPWTIDLDQLDARFGFRQSLLINDMTALSCSLPALGQADLLVLQQGRVRGGTRAVLAPGTGLGEGMVVEVSGRLNGRGCEGGHADFAPVDDLQMELLAWMRRRRRQVSYEDLVAGPGIPSLYDFIKEYEALDETPQVAADQAAAVDRTPVILSAGIADQPCPLCTRVIDLFLSILGSEAGNLVLKLFADGGLYLGGGILPRLVGRVSFDGFLQAFINKAMMGGFLREVPVRLITKSDAVLLGAATYGRWHLAGVRG